MVTALGVWKSYPRATLRGSALRAASRTANDSDKTRFTSALRLGCFYLWKASRDKKKKRDMKKVKNKSSITH